MQPTKSLYKTDTKGKLRVLKISVQKDELVFETGVLDGKLIEHRKVCTPKNVGKANATTGEEQAVLEMNSKIKDELTGGYFETVEEASKTKAILPMLAKEYEKEIKKVIWSNGVYIQPKLDGMRCLAFIKANGTVTLMSRDGKIITTMPHIEVDLKKIKEDIILDGELYAHGHTFQENMSLIKKYRTGETEKVKYNVYDIVEEKPFSERTELVKKYMVYPTLAQVITYLVTDEAELSKHHEVFISEGFEGTMLRHSDDHYKIAGRSSSLLKYKFFLDIALPILDVIPAKQRPDWGVPVFNVKGKRFEAGTRLSHAERRDLLANKTEYIGKTAELRFFQYSDTGVPRFPVMHGIRLDK